jgi:hypothetical protein
MALHDGPCGSRRGLVALGEALAVVEAGVDVRQRGIELGGSHAAPCLGRIPALHGLDVVAGRVDVIAVAERHANQLEPCGPA